MEKEGSMSEGLKNEILRVQKGERREKKRRYLQEEWIPLEVFRRIYINDLRIATLIASPGYEKELALGFCFSEGFLKKEDVKKILVEGENIFISTEADFREREFLLDSSGCLGTRISELPEVSSEIRVKVDTILEAVKELNSEEYEKSKGIHSACFFKTSGELVKRISDVGRSNALDKIIGWCLLNEVKMEDGFIFLSGRHSASTIMKIARAGIPIAISKTSSLSMAIDLANICKITLCSFADEKKVLVYTHPERII
jgi:FdhD protein